MPDIAEIFQPFILNWDEFEVLRNSDVLKIDQDLASHLPRLLKNFSLQIDPELHRNLELRLTRKSDSDAQALYEFLNHAIIRHVEGVSFDEILEKNGEVPKPSPAIAVYRSNENGRFPDSVGLTKFEPLAKILESNIYEQAIENRSQSCSQAPRKSIWNKLFQTFLFGPVVQICDPYLLQDIVNKGIDSGAAADRTGFGYLLRRLAEDRMKSRESEDGSSLRRLQILTSATRDRGEARKNQEYFFDLLEIIVSKINPNFAVEVTITDYPSKDKKKVLHDRFFMVNKNGSVVRTMSVTNSVSAYLSEFPSTTPITFTVSSSGNTCQLFGNFWTKEQQIWRTRGAHLEWEPSR